MTLALREQEATGQQLSPAGLAYQRAWDRVQRLQSQLADMDTAAQTHQAAMAQLVPPWRAAYRAHLQAVVQALGAALAHGGPGLSPTQRRTAQAALQAHADALDALASRVQTRAPSEPEPEPEAGTEHAAPGAVPDAQAAKRAARQAKREQRAARQRATPAGQADALAQQGADTTLRALYRQLASALHPDREPEGPARDRKNTLMGEANAAYQRQDMAALLRLQHTVLAEASTPPDTAGSDQRLAALARLLQQQAADLDRQRQAAQQRWWAVLVLPQGTPLTAAHLAGVWARAQADKMANEAAMAEELAQLQRPNTLKGWLNGWRERQAG